MPVWVNNDGLVVKYGVDEILPSTVGEYVEGVGPYHVTEILINPLTALSLTPVIVNDSVRLPAGARIEAVDVIADAAATSGGAAALNVGLIREDRTTVVAAGGLVNALALANINALGKVTRLTQGVTGAGTLVGTVLANPSLITVDYDTAVYTAGAVRLRVQWYIP